MNENYIFTVMLMLHFVLLIESFLIAFCFIKDITFAKAPTTDNVLFILNISKAFVGFYSLVYFVFEANFIYHYFIYDTYYAYEIFALITQATYMATFLFQKIIEDYSKKKV